MQNSDILDPFQDYKRLELRKAIFSPEMSWETVLQCRCTKSERLFTLPCGFDLWYFQNVVVSERIFRAFHMDKIMKTDGCKFINYFICFQSHGSHSSNLQGRHLSFL